MIFYIKKNYYQFIKFCIIGASNTIVQLLVYYSLIYLGLYYLIANIVGFVISVLNSYIWNKKFTFKHVDSDVMTIIRLYLSYGTTTLASTGLLYLLVDIVGINKLISPIINIGLFLPINFILNKYFVFKIGKK